MFLLETHSSVCGASGSTALQRRTIFSFQGAPSCRLRSTILVTSRRIAGRKHVQTFSVSPCVWSRSSTVSHVSIRYVFTRMCLVSSPGSTCACTSPSCSASWTCARTVVSPRITLVTSSRCSTLGSRLESHSSPRKASMVLVWSSAARAARRLRRRARRNSPVGRARAQLALEVGGARWTGQPKMEHGAQTWTKEDTRE